jgi:hypothetical protein
MRSIKITALLCASLVFPFNIGCNHESPEKTIDEPTTAAVSVEASADIDFSKYETFELSSDDLHDGVWDTVITKTANGENCSPQLSWKAVDGAGAYAIFMIDTSAGNWLHWASVSGSETSLQTGWASEHEYVGPYPPNGTHDYEVYVFALKNSPQRIKGAFDSSNAKMFAYFGELDGEGGNILSYGHIKGTYTHGD